MAWSERAPSGNYFVCFRIGGQRFRRSLKTTSEKEAAASIARIEENLQLLERGRLEIPQDADIVSFLLSDGRVNGPVSVAPQVTLSSLFDVYFKAIPTGNLEATTVYGMKLHRKQLEEHFGKSFWIRYLTRDQLQEFIQVRSLDTGRHGEPLAAATIRKAIVTLRTVWNWAREGGIVERGFPSRGLKYPKSKEKVPFMSFTDVERMTSGMGDVEAAELWECVYLRVEEIDDLLRHVEGRGLPFVYPMFVFAAHTGARRSEIMRSRIPDIDLKNGWVTLHERKRAHDKKTTRRVPISARLHTVLTDWLSEHPGGDSLFCHASEVSRSRKRSRTTGHRSKNRPTSLFGRLATVTSRLEQPNLGPLTRDEMHDHFKRALAGSKWEKLKGWHVFRHSFISCLAAKGVDQRIIDDFVGHCTEEQRRRYRHLFPSVTKHAIASVFG